MPHHEEEGYCLVVPSNKYYLPLGYVNVPVHLKPSTRYRLSFRARATNDQALATVYERDAHNNNVRSHNIRVPKSDEWVTLEKEFETAANTDMGFSTVSFRCDGERRDCAWFDDVRVEILGPVDN